MNPRTKAPWKFSHVIEHTSEGDKTILSIQDRYGNTIALFPMYNTLDNPVTNLMVRAPELRNEVEKLNAEIEKLKHVPLELCWSHYCGY